MYTYTIYNTYVLRTYTCLYQTVPSSYSQLHFTACSIPLLFHLLWPTVPPGIRICLPGYKSHRKYCNNCCCCCAVVDNFLVCGCSTKCFKKSRAWQPEREGSQHRSAAHPIAESAMPPIRHVHPLASTVSCCDSCCFSLSSNFCSDSYFSFCCFSCCSSCSISWLSLNLNQLVLAMSIHIPLPYCVRAKAID